MMERHAGGRPLMIAWRAGDDVAALKAAYQREARRDVRPRLHALWLVRTGECLREAARVVGVHERNVQRWIGWYRTGGMAAVAAHRRQGTGKPAFLSAAQQDQLTAHTATGAIRTAAQARAWVAQTFGVTYRPGGMYTLLGRLTIHPKVPRPVNPKADLDAQDRWKKGDARPR